LKGRFNTFDLLVKVVCIVKKRQIIFSIKNELMQTSEYKEINHTEPSPSISSFLMGTKRKSKVLETTHPY
jgi:hypothetical protein